MCSQSGQFYRALSRGPADSRGDHGRLLASGRRITLAVLLTVVGAVTQAQAYTPAATKVADGVYVIVGPTGGRSYENRALNNNLGFVVTGEGVVVIDSGASAEGARLVEQAVKAVTEQPVRWVINTGSQDHRWLYCYHRHAA